MQEEMIVDRTGTILEHENCEAIGRNMNEYVTTWHLVAEALAQVAETGAADAIICGVANAGWDERVVELQIRRTRGSRLRVVAIERPQLAHPLVLKVLHRGRPVREVKVDDPRPGIAAKFNSELADSYLRMCLQ
jgi:hypothetical protein